MTKVLVSELINSIQGEGIHTGLPTIFVRLQGCNLLTHCSWCDTVDAQDGSKGTIMEVTEILDQCVKLEGRTYKHWVCITGGEPLFQPEPLHELVKGLSRYGFKVEVETNGSIQKPYWWTLVDSWVADIKCPSSGVCGVSLEEWFDTRGCDQIKFVVGDKRDLNFARSMIRRNVTRNPVVLVSPVLDGSLFSLPDLLRRYNYVITEKITAELDLGYEWLQEVVEFCKELNIRFSLQVHKVVWGNRRGV